MGYICFNKNTRYNLAPKLFLQIYGCLKSSTVTATFRLISVPVNNNFELKQNQKKILLAFPIFILTLENFDLWD